jgi:hypothetical protein
MKYEKFSTLIPILTDIISKQSDPEVVRTIALNKIKESKANLVSKLSMVKTLTDSKDPVNCIFNLILKYEGNGVIR